MRFTLRTLLLALAVVCLALKAGLILKERCETRSIAECLAVANAKASQDEFGRLAPPLTEEAVLAWVEKRLQVVNDPEWVKHKLRRIARSGRLPLDARIRGCRITWIEHLWFVKTARSEWQYDLYLTDGASTFRMDIPASLTPAPPPSALPPSCRWWAKMAADAR